MPESADKERQVQAVLASLALPAGITIRPWRADDFPAVQQMWNVQGWSTPRRWPEDARRAWQASWPALTAMAGETSAGFLRAITDGFVTIYLAEILVAPRLRGQGIGQALIETCHLLYPSARIDLLSTESADDFYTRLGFRPFRAYRKAYR